MNGLLKADNTENFMISPLPSSSFLQAQIILKVDVYIFLSAA